MTMTGDSSSHSNSAQRRRAVESVVLAKMIERGRDGLTESQLIDDLTTVADTSERVAAIRWAIEGLVAVGLLVWTDDLLRPTPAALRSGELELGL
jgi:hypothetical protein